jgi:FtsH-binding integral membrane protein
MTEKINQTDIKEMMDDITVNPSKEYEMKNQEVALNINSEPENENFEEKINMEIRLGFIRKVYGILSLQLLITVIFCAASFNTGVKTFLLENQVFFWLAAALSFVLIIPLICFKSVMRRVPINYLLLLAWTMCEAYLVSCCCAIYDPQTVIMAAVATLAVTVSLTIYAWTTKTDFTFCGGMLFTAICLLFVLTLFSFVFPFLNALICVFGVMIYSLYLLYDTQLIFGKVGLEYDVEDYILASLNVYLDIIQIFLYMLEIIGSLSNN